MNFKDIVSDIEKADPSKFQEVTNRRDILKSIGKKVALAAVPLSVNSLFSTKSNAQTTSTSVLSSLNFALQLEYFEYNFFRTGNSTGGLIPSSDLPGFLAIEKHELAHINFLINTITGMGGTAFVPKYYSNNPFCPAAYDFTAGGQYQIYTSGNYYLYLDLAQVFEDLIVRAYNGILANLTSNASVLTSIAQLQSVEGRHASHVRYVRRFSTTAPENPKPWITNNIPVSYYPITNFQPFYNGEDNQVQYGIDITTLPGITGTLSQTAATEAFDEPLDQATVLSYLAPFLLP